MSPVSRYPDRWLHANERAHALARGEIPGWLASLLLHLLFVSLLLVFIRSTPQVPRATQQLIPVNVVKLGENPASPAQHLKAAASQQETAVRRVTHRSVPAATAPARKLSPPDSLDAQLRALAKLREPKTNLPVLDKAGASNVDAMSDDTVGSTDAAYGVRDYIRNQVERRWSLNLAHLGGNNFTVRIHVAISRTGSVTKAEIVDRARFASDAAWRDIALSARNAVLLSSPIVLPAGQRDTPLDLILRLDPKDALR